MFKRFLPFLLVFSLLVLVGCGGNNETSSNSDQSTDQTTEESDKPDNYIEDLDLNTTLQKGFNQRMMLIGHFEREDMSAEEKINFAQETEQTILPEIQTLTYNMRVDSDDGGDYNNINLYLDNAYGSIRNMCDDTIKYYQEGDENAKTEFYDQSQRALENLQKAQNELDQ